MCGVVGAIAPMASPEWRAELLWKQLIACQARGKDATGVGWHDEHGNPQVVKGPVTGSEFCSGELFEQVANQMPLTWIGHCRAKTKGEPKFNQNNHPVYSKISGVMLVHNGRVDDDKWRRQKNGVNPYMYGSFDGEVDTEAALRLIETMRYIPRREDLSIDPKMVEQTPKDDWTPLVPWFKAVDDAVYNMGGGYVLNILTPDEPHSVILVRHDNPLFVAYVPGQHAVVWASTFEILKASLTTETRETLFDYFPTVTKQEEVFHYREVDADTMVQITYAGDRFDITSKKINPPGRNETRTAAVQMSDVYE